MSDRGLEAESAEAEPKSGGQKLWEQVSTLLFAVLIALGIRAFVIEPFRIPSGSMLPTLLVGDYLFVSKFSYGYSKHSLPFSPSLFKGRIFFSAPKRGDVIVFKLPTDNSTDYIKRLIGLPGDRIQVIRGRLHINGRMVPRTSIGQYTDIERDHGGYKVRYKSYREVLPNGVSYIVLERGDDIPFVDNTDVYVVPKGHYFMMGDNRDNSRDSRFIGAIPETHLVGEAVRIWMHMDGLEWPEWARIGTKIE